MGYSHKKTSQLKRIKYLKIISDNNIALILLKVEESGGGRPCILFGYVQFSGVIQRRITLRIRVSLRFPYRSYP